MRRVRPEGAKYLLDNVFQAVGGSWFECWVWASLGFAEVPLPPTQPQPSVATRIELQRADGTRLCLPIPMSPPLLGVLPANLLDNANASEDKG